MSDDDVVVNSFMIPQVHTESIFEAIVEKSTAQCGLNRVALQYASGLFHGLHFCLKFKWDIAVSGSVFQNLNLVVGN